MHQMNHMMYSQHHQQHHHHQQYRQSRSSSSPLRSRAQNGQNGQHQQPDVDLRCCECKQQFGSFYVGQVDERIKLADDLNPISSAIKNLDHVLRMPMALKCKHHLCQHCLQENFARSTQNSFNCPKCQALTFETGVKPDYELLGKLVADDEPSFDLRKELMSWPYYNQENERLVAKEFEKFILRCSICSRSDQIDHGHGHQHHHHQKNGGAKGPAGEEPESGAFANLFCADCNAIFCDACHVELRGQFNHQVTPIGEYFSTQNKCVTHPKNTAQHYCLDCRVFLCKLCCMESSKLTHANHRIVCLMSKHFEGTFANSFNLVLKNCLVNSYRLLKAIENELIFILNSVVFQHDNIKMVKQNVQSLLRKKSQIIQAMHICETISSFFNKYFSSHDHQMFDRSGKKLIHTTRSYASYIQSVVQPCGIQIYSSLISNAKNLPKFDNHPTTMQRLDISNTIQTALDNLRFFLAVRDKYLRVYALADWLPNAPQVKPYDFTSNACSFAQTNKIQLLKPNDFTTASVGKDQTVTDNDSPMLLNELMLVNNDGDSVFGTYGRGALMHVYDNLDARLNQESNEYNVQKMDTYWQVDRYDYRRITQEVRMRREEYLSYDDENNNHHNVNINLTNRSMTGGSVCNQKSPLAGDVSMTGLSSDCGSYAASDDEAGRAPKKLTIGTTMSVQIGSKFSPTLFSVVPEKDSKYLSDLAPRVSVWCSENQDLVTLSDQEIADVKAGDVFAHYRQDVRLWTRLRVNSVQLDESEPANSTLLAHFIDIGDIYQVQPNTLLKLDKSLADAKQTVITCYLFNIRPYVDPNSTTEATNGSEEEVGENERRSFKWKAHALQLLQMWAEGKPISMTILENKYDGFYGVDLTFDLGELIRTDSGLKSCTVLYDVDESSVIEAFIKCKLARYINEQDEMAFRQMSRKMPKYMQMQALYTNEKCLANLSHLDSLNEFYLRKLYSENDNSMSFSDLSRRMQSLYNSNGNSFFVKVFAPVARMPVAAVFPADESWYRGEIVEVNPDELSCRVLFVDFGNVETIPLDRLRYLTKEIIIDDVRTFNCRLFGISFKTAENLTEAFNYVYETLANLRDRGLPIQVHVKKIIETDSSFTNKQGIHEIIMRYPIENKITNVNVMLNKIGFAETDDLSIYDGEKEPTKVEDTNETKIVKKQPRPTPLERVAKEVCGISVNKFKSKPVNSVYCKVKNAVSPSEIWVQDIVDADACFEQFHKKFCKLYQELTTAVVDQEVAAEDVEPAAESTTAETRPSVVRTGEWKVGDLAVILKNKSSPTPNFYRCKIHKLLTEGTCQVICVDTGEYATAGKENLFELVEEYIEKPDFKAKKCFLVGVQPTGTTNGQWSSLAKVFTAETLEDSMVYVVFTSGRRADDSYETIIYVNTSQAKNVNNLTLLDQGKENEFIKLSDILNLKGYAMLLAKKKALDMMLDYQHSFNSAALLTIHGSYHSYPTPAILAKTSFGDNAQSLHQVLVTHVDLGTGDSYVQFLQLFHTRQSLRRMAYDFQNAYRSGDRELKFRAEDLRRHLSHTAPQAYVCKLKNRYYRCELNRKETMEHRLLDDKAAMRVFLIDYGFSADVQVEDIYRPLIAYLTICPLALRLRVDLNPAFEYKQDKGAVIHSLLHNRLAKARVHFIEDKHALCGDLYCPEVKKWLSSHLLLDESQPELPSNGESMQEAAMAEEVNSFKQFALKPELIEQPVPVVVTWIDSINSIWLEVKPDDESAAEASLRLERIHESMFEAFQKRALRNLNMQEIRENAPCCSIYKNDSKVYRAKILRANYIEEMAVVRYVDFGNEEEIGFEELFELNKEFVDLCEQAVQCRLKNVAINTPGNELLTPNELKALINEIHNQLDQTLNEYNDEEKTLCAKLSKLDIEDESYEAELIFVNKVDRSPDAPQPTSAYQSLVDNGLLRFKGGHQ